VTLLAACTGAMPGDTVLYGVCAYAGVTDPSQCDPSQSCTAANTPDPSGLVGAHCTHACRADGDCRAGRSGARAVCVASADGGGGGGQCYETCGDGGAGCVYDQRCVQPPGASSTVCVPTGYDAGDAALGGDDVGFDDVPFPPDDAGGDDAGALDAGG
jgi:hypothetical protein